MLHALRLSILLLVTVPVSFGLRDRADAARNRAIREGARGMVGSRESLRRSMIRTKALATE